ncbi:zinc-binding dehydrogenase [Cytobacillus depressus]|uniref:Zinc-binding dehydrogenase n=1 Tax=Cytobacillus depressus TaxID=1602942 RepID=A0A6L3V7S3_9BACI|nr:zinc-binding dehydrogenase [Cytobacillus depressus]KAB2336300.1 zinc-binding dehydrogenase [Cytobacillus depressus]
MKGKLAVMTKPGKLEMKEYALPKVEPGAVLAKILRANVCGSEIHIWKGEHPTKKSGCLGHEMVGEIAALGEGVQTDNAGNPVKVGDRIAAVYYLTCGKCSYCNNYQYHLCENAYNYYSRTPEEFPHFHGTFGTHYYIHPDQHFYKVPDNVPNSVAASANCALSQVYFGIDKAGIGFGHTVVIQGAGGLGLNATAIAKEFGATVIVIDSVESRLEIAKHFGADHVINMNEYETIEKRAALVYKLTNGKGADVAMELTGVPAAFQEGIHLIRLGGKYVSIGNLSPGKFTSFDPGLMTRKSIQILSLVRYDPTYLNKALQFLSRTIDKYPFVEMIDQDFDLNEIERALDKSVSREVTRASININNHHFSRASLK